METDRRRYIRRGESGGVENDNFPYISDFARQNYLRGQVESGANAILTVLVERGMDVPADARDRILACTDTAKLETWLRRAAVVYNLDEVFAEEEGQVGSKR